MKPRPATPDEQSQVEALGLRLAEACRDFVMGFAPGGAEVDEQTLNGEIGGLLVMAVASAANDADWLNRVWLIDGLGEGLGQLFASWPEMDRALDERLAAGISRGRALRRQLPDAPP